MRTMLRNLSFATFVLAGMGIVSCTSNEELNDPEVIEQNKKTEFADNFTKTFGTIGANQNWDFADGVMTRIASVNTRAISNPLSGITYIDCTKGTTYIDNNYAFLTDGYFYVPAAMQNNMNQMIEDKDNSMFGNVWAMSIPECNFSIIPIRQGQSSEGFELHMVIGQGSNATDYLLWSKGTLVQKSVKGKNSWSTVTKDYNNGTTFGNYDVRSKVLTFKNMPTNEPMYFYLYRPTSKEYPSSLEGYMKDLTSAVGVPQELVKAGKHVKVIGAEARWDKALTDWDYEDVMFMIVGDPTLPEEITPDGLKFKQTITKRYMIEDLGNTNDTDFNDIVVDVERSRDMAATIDPKNGQITERIFGKWEEKAVIRHLGGRLPFQLTIGNTTHEWIQGQIDVDVNIEFPVEGWNPDTNNISIKVKQEEGNVEGLYTINFPKEGSVPMMVATSPKQAWSPERVSFLETVKELIKNTTPAK